MKTIVKSFLITTLLATSLTACFEQNEEQSTNPTLSNLSIEGEWKVSITEVQLYLNDIPMREYLIEELNYEDTLADLMVQEKITDLLHSDSDSLSIVFHEDHHFDSYSHQEAIGSGTYELSTDGGTLTLLENGEESIFTVTYLEVNHLRLQSTQEGEVDVDYDGTTETLKVDISMDLFKID